MCAARSQAMRHGAGVHESARPRGPGLACGAAGRAPSPAGACVAGTARNRAGPPYLSALPAGAGHARRRSRRPPVTSTTRWNPCRPPWPPHRRLAWFAAARRRAGRTRAATGGRTCLRARRRGLDHGDARAARACAVPRHARPRPDACGCARRAGDARQSRHPQQRGARVGGVPGRRSRDRPPEDRRRAAHRFAAAPSAAITPPRSTRGSATAPSHASISAWRLHLPRPWISAEADAIRTLARDHRSCRTAHAQTMAGGTQSVNLVQRVRLGTMAGALIIVARWGEVLAHEPGSTRVDIEIAADGMTTVAVPMDPLAVWRRPCSSRSRAVCPRARGR